MRYYYGNSLKEAISNNPVEIESTKILSQYEGCYSFVIPESDIKLEDLPTDRLVELLNEYYCDNGFELDNNQVFKSEEETRDKILNNYEFCDWYEDSIMF